MAAQNYFDFMRSLIARTKRDSLDRRMHEQRLREGTALIDRATRAQNLAVNGPDYDEETEGRWTKAVNVLAQRGYDPTQIEKAIPGFKEYVISTPLITPKGIAGYDDPSFAAKTRAFAEALGEEKWRQDESKRWEQTYGLGGFHSGNIGGPPPTRNPHPMESRLGMGPFFDALNLKELVAAAQGKRLNVDLAGQGPGTGTGVGTWKATDEGTGKPYALEGLRAETPPGLLPPAERNKYYATHPFAAAAGAKAVENLFPGKGLVGNPRSGGIPEAAAATPGMSGSENIEREEQQQAQWEPLLRQALEGLRSLGRRRRPRYGRF